MRQLLSLTFSLITICTFAQPFSRSFELRYFTKDPAANGETDFKGETEWMDTGQRISFLNKYAKFASVFFHNPGLDDKIISDTEIDSLLNKVKPQPTTSVRTTINLDTWKTYGYRKGQDREKAGSLKVWGSYPGTIVRNGSLKIENATINRPIDSLTWRFKVEATLKSSQAGSCLINLLDNRKQAVFFGFEGEMLIFGTANKTEKIKIRDVVEGWIKLSAEADLTQKRFNLYVNDKLVQYDIAMMDTSAAAVTELSIHSKGISYLNDILIFNHTPTGNVRYPYVSNVILDQNFQEKPPVDGWQEPDFDDSHWKEAALPSVHGGLREKDEAYYLRKKIRIDNFKRASLKFETIDPGGEVWINGKVVYVANTRYPVELDVTRYLVGNSENTIAVKVNPYKLHNPMAHTPTDHYTGWFLGRAQLELSGNCKITGVQVFTKEIGDTAIQFHKINIQYPAHRYFEGSIEVNYYPWFPKEGSKVASIRQELNIPPRIDNEYGIDCMVPYPKLWSCSTPNLYKVEVILYDKTGKAVDDCVTTTGIRTVGQGQGNFYINGEPEMLNGAQIMGFRMPVETIAKYNRSAPWQTVAEEMLMIKKMRANMLRIHVHAEKDTIDGINDPRYAELADQMGIMLIWQTAGWIREGEAWNVDFEGYPRYMKQVYNHPGIVMWEASNHPNKFKKHDLSATNDYIKRIYDAIYFPDSGRLLSPTTFWQHTHYTDYRGTLDYLGNKIGGVPEFNAPMVTRGSQDAYTGYGNNWTTLRNAPNNWAASCLLANEKAYFNFEHEESIGQPNWELCKGKPWYLLPSYEWDHDEGSIGRKLQPNEWRESQAWQAFSAWESMKKQILLGYDGFSWCCLRGGANMGTYKKPLVDNLGHPKLAYYTNRMVFQRTWAGSNNVDVVYGPDDEIIPVIHHIGKSKEINLVVTLLDSLGVTVGKKEFNHIYFKEEERVKEMEGFRFKGIKDGIYAIQFELFEIIH